MLSSWSLPAFPLLRMLEEMIFFLTGKRIRLQSPDLDLDGWQTPSLAAAGFGLSYDYHEVTVESESVSYEAAGFVTTADGKRIIPANTANCAAPLCTCGRMGRQAPFTISISPCSIPKSCIEAYMQK